MNLNALIAHTSLKLTTFSLVVAIAAGCSTPTVQAPTEDTASKPEIDLGYTPKFNDYDPVQAQVWQSYAYALHDCGQRFPAYSFEREVCARSATAAKIDDLNLRPSHAHKSLLEIAKAHRAGFMREYTWHFLNKPYWIKPHGLSMGKFKTWQKMGLPGHLPNREPGVFLKETPQTVIHDSTLVKLVEESSINPGYPNVINRFKFAGHTQYSDSSLGEKIRYISGTTKEMESFIYPVPAPFENQLDQTVIRGLFSAEKAVMISQQASSVINGLKVISEGEVENTFANFNLQQGLYAIDSSQGRFYKSIYLSVYENHLIKISFNQQINPQHQGPVNFHDDALAFFAWAKAKIDYDISNAQQAQEEPMHAALD